MEPVYTAQLISVLKQVMADQQDSFFENKQFDKGAPETLSFPLLSIPTATGSTLHSPKIGNANGLTDLVTGNERELLVEVLEVRESVMAGVFPHEFMAKYYPSAWGEYEEVMPAPLVAENLRLNYPIGCASVVHMDSPVDVALAALSWVNSDGAAPAVLSTGHVDFLNRNPDAIELIGQYVKTALDDAFEAKYYFGIVRPEELACANITHYPEGCPNHPSFPAGHGAAAGAGIQAIIDHFDLDSDQLKTVRDTAYFWAMFRTFAGVHYAVDNLAGLEVGGLAIT